MDGVLLLEMWKMQVWLIADMQSDDYGSYDVCCLIYERVKGQRTGLAGHMHTGTD